MDASTCLNAETDFAAAIAACGLGSPSITADGDIHRFRVVGDKAGTLNGWYSLHLDGRPAGVFGTWKTGEQHTWVAGGSDGMTAAERAMVRAMIERSRAMRDAETRERHQAAASRAASMWESASAADPHHPYLLHKSIYPHGARQQGIGLLVPVYVGDALASVQTIDPNGSKRFLRGGKTIGSCYQIGTDITRTEILIAEGFATGATLHQEIGAAVYVAFNANNLAPVARYVRRLHPKAEIIVCADDDRWTEGNPGRTKARAAAVEIGAKLLVPDFTGMDTSGKPSDFNDWYSLRRAGVEVAA